MLQGVRDAEQTVEINQVGRRGFWGCLGVWPSTMRGDLGAVGDGDAVLVRGGVRRNAWQGFGAAQVAVAANHFEVVGFGL